jgi:GntR family transcriptional regulator
MISDDKLSPAMGVKRGTPLMYIETIDVNHDNQPVLYAREYYVAEHFEFLVLRRSNGSGSPVP